MNREYKASILILASLCIVYVLIQATDYGGPYLYIASGVFAAGLGISFGREVTKTDEVKGIGKYFVVPMIALITYALAIAAIALPVQLLSELTGGGA